MRDGEGKPLFTIEKMREMLWGNWFYNKKKKTFTTEQFNKKGKAFKRTFCKFVLDPIIKMCKICMEGTMEQIDAACKQYKININPKTDFRDKKGNKIDPGRKLNKIVFQKWLNASDAILEMVVC